MKIISLSDKIILDCLPDTSYICVHKERQMCIRDSIKQTWDSLRVETQAFNYAFMKEHINQTVGKFLYKMIKTSLTEELRKELDEANH